MENIYNGSCRYCGQVHIVNQTKEDNQESVNEKATSKCSCEEAKWHQERKYALKRAADQIEDLFGEGAEEYGLQQLSVGAREMLLNITTMVYDGTFKDASINITSSGKLKIKKSAKGKLTFERSEVNAIKHEV